MFSYSYYKALKRAESPLKTFQKTMVQRLVRLLPNILIVVGATAVTTVVYPMISYQVTTQQWEQKKIISPLPKDQQASAYTGANVSGSTPTIAYGEGTDQPVVVTDIDYTKAINWFPGASVQDSSVQLLPKATSYTLSIPKLKIEDMNVIIGSNDLDKSLIHYSGTALPGEYGNPVIFGHSVLPVFYNPKSYISVFSKLPTLKEDDEIFLNYDGVEYRYVVESYHEVQPTHVEVLEQRYDRQQLTLITCVPPGTYLRRGVIQARLEKF